MKRTNIAGVPVAGAGGPGRRIPVIMTGRVGALRGRVSASCLLRLDAPPVSGQPAPCDFWAETAQQALPLTGPDDNAKVLAIFVAVCVPSPVPSRHRDPRRRRRRGPPADRSLLEPERVVSVDNSRKGILQRFREQVARGEPIIGGGAGTGLSAKSEEAGGIDLLIVYNSGRYRMAGRGSSAGLLAYGNANQIVKEMAYEILPVVEQTPVLAGVNGTDPFIIPKLFLEELRAMGFAGVQNFPTVGLFDGDMRQAFEETGMSYQLEVDIIRLAREIDLLTTPYVFNPSEAERMAGAGADVIVAHMGVTTGGSIGAKSSKTLEDCVGRIQEIADAARGVNPEVLVICHGGPIAEPSDAEYILTRCRGVDGFYGASSVERLPAERAIADQIRRFKDIRLPAASRSAQTARVSPRTTDAPASRR
jgi:predicted TIM-barrel enzyme